MGDTSTLPPIWIDIYEETQEKLKRINEISNWGNIEKRIKLKNRQRRKIPRRPKNKETIW